MNQSELSQQAYFLVGFYRLKQILMEISLSYHLVCIQFQFYCTCYKY
jgi:hypothetical protein